MRGHFFLQGWVTNIPHNLRPGSSGFYFPWRVLFLCLLLFQNNDLGSHCRNSDLGHHCCLCYSFRVRAIQAHSCFESWLSTKQPLASQLVTWHEEHLSNFGVVLHIVHRSNFVLNRNTNSLYIVILSSNWTLNNL
jgi:hypothetical protein